MLKIKKYVTDVVPIFAPYYYFKDEEVRLIEETFGFYYAMVEKMYGKNQVDKAIIKYSLENKEKKEFLAFDLALNLFFGLISAYKQR